MKIRKARESDKKRILDMLNSEPAMREEDEISYDEDTVEEYIKGKAFETFVLEINGKIIGFVIANVRRIGGYAELYNVAVDKKYRKKGIGTKLVKFMEEHLRKIGIGAIFLYTSKENESMKKLSEKMGYKQGRKFISYSKTLKK